MKEILAQLNPAFEHRNRLGIMAMLVANDWIDYNTLRDTLGLTDGNLASHLSALEERLYITVRKQFVGRKPRTTYAVTPDGRDNFRAHLDVLEVLLRLSRDDE